MYNMLYIHKDPTKQTVYVQTFKFFKAITYLQTFCSVKLTR